MFWEDKDRDIANITKNIITPPIGMQSYYSPGGTGLMEKGVGPPPEEKRIDLNAPGGQQNRLAQLEAVIPLPQTGFTLPANQAIPALSNIGTAAAVEAPKFNISNEWKDYFNDAIQSILKPSKAEEILTMQAQGFGLPIGEVGGFGRSAAAKALSKYTGEKRSAIAHLARTMSDFLVEPSRFERDIYGKRIELERAKIAQGTMDRRTALEEAKLPWEIRKMERQAPETATGFGPGGERITFGWEPENKRWGTLSKGAVPVEVHEGGKLIDPVSGKEIAAGGEKARFKENIGLLAFKEYADELKNIENDLRFTSLEGDKPGKKEAKLKLKAAAQEQAYGRLANMMERLGYGDMFKQKGPQEGEVRPGQFGKYIFKNGKWDIYQE